MYGVINALTKVNGKKIKSMEEVSISGQMAGDMMENGRII